MKYNDYSIKKLQNKNLYVVLDKDKELCYYNKNLNRCVNFINNMDGKEKKND